MILSLTEKQEIRANGAKYQIPSCCVESFIELFELCGSPASYRGVIRNPKSPRDVWVPCSYHTINPPENMIWEAVGNVAKVAMASEMLEV